MINTPRNEFREKRSPIFRVEQIFRDRLSENAKKEQYSEESKNDERINHINRFEKQNDVKMNENNDYFCKEENRKREFENFNEIQGSLEIGKSDLEELNANSILRTPQRSANNQISHEWNSTSNNFPSGGFYFDEILSDNERESDQSQIIYSDWEEGKLSPQKAVILLEDKARFHFENKDYQKAINSYEKIYKIDDNNAHIKEMIGHCYLLLKNISKASEFYQKSPVGLSQSNVIIKFKKATLFEKAENFEEALNLYKQCLKNSPGYVKIEVLKKIAIILLKISNFDLALRILDNLTRIENLPFRVNIDILTKMGIIHFEKVLEEKKDYEISIQFLNQVNAFNNSSNNQILLLLSWVYFKMNDILNCSRMTEDVMKRNSMDSDAIYIKSRIEIQKENYVNADQFLDQALKIKCSPLYLCTKGIVEAKQLKYTEALHYIMEALKIDGNFFDAWFNLGLIYQILNIKGECLNALAYCQRFDPNSEDVSELIEIINNNDPSNNITKTMINKLCFPEFRLDNCFRCKKEYYHNENINSIINEMISSDLIVNCKNIKLEEPHNMWQEEFFSKRFLNPSIYSSGESNHYKNNAFNINYTNHISESRRYQNHMSENLNKTRPLEGTKYNEFRSEKPYYHSNPFSLQNFHHSQYVKKENYPGNFGQNLNLNLNQNSRESRNSTELKAIYLPIQNQLYKTLSNIYDMINKNSFPVIIDHPQPNLAFTDPQISNPHFSSDNVQNNYAGFLILNPLEFQDHMMPKSKAKQERSKEEKNNLNSTLDNSHLKQQENNIYSIASKNDKNIYQEFENNDNVKIKKPRPIKAEQKIEPFFPHFDEKKIDNETREKFKILSKTADSFKPHPNSHRIKEKDQSISMIISRNIPSSNEKSYISEEYESLSTPLIIDSKKDPDIIKETNLGENKKDEKIKEEKCNTENNFENIYAEQEISNSNVEVKEPEEKISNPLNSNQMEIEIKEEIEEKISENDSIDNDILIVKDFRYIRKKKGKPIKKQFKKHKRNK